MLRIRRVAKFQRSTNRFRSYTKKSHPHAVNGVQFQVFFLKKNHFSKKVFQRHFFWLEWLQRGVYDLLSPFYRSYSRSTSIVQSQLWIDANNRISKYRADLTRVTDFKFINYINFFILSSKAVGRILREI